MPSLLVSIAALAALSARTVLAHSHVDYLIIDGLLYPGFDPKTSNNLPNVIGWSTSASDDGFVPPSNYSTPDIICHRDGAPPKAHVPVRPGASIHVQWNGWPQSHHGPVLSYLAPCPSGAADGCASVDKHGLSFFKIDNSAPVFLNESGGPPGLWASDVLIASNNSWQVELPPALKPGPYVLRHELIALHYANQPDGAQNYPQCFNLWVSDSGTATSWDEVSEPAAEADVVERSTPSGVGVGQGIPATALYKSSDPGININIYTTLTTYQIPGPTVVSGAAPIPLSRQSKSISKADGTPVSITGTSTAKPFPATPTGSSGSGRRGEYPRAMPRRHLAPV